MMAQQQQQEERREAFEEQKENMLRVILSPEGRERLKRISQVKPDRAETVEMHIIEAVRGGKLQAPVSDEVVREILGRMSGQESEGKGQIKIVRKKNDDDW